VLVLFFLPTAFVSLLTSRAQNGYAFRHIELTGLASVSQGDGTVAVCCGFGLWQGGKKFVMDTQSYVSTLYGIEYPISKLGD